MDILTVEIEHIDAKALEDVIRDLNVDVEPIPATLRLIQVGVTLHAGGPQPHFPATCQRTRSVLLQPKEAFAMHCRQVCGDSSSTAPPCCQLLALLLAFLQDKL